MNNFLKFKNRIREGFGLLLAVGLCDFIIHPYILALALSLALRIQTDSSVTSYNICKVMEVLAMVPTAFIMGLIVSWFWKTKEVKGSFIASILMGTYYVGMHVFSIIVTTISYPDGDISKVIFDTRLNLELFGSLAMLFLFSFCAAKLMHRIRHLKIEKVQSALIT